MQIVGIKRDLTFCNTYFCIMKFDIVTIVGPTASGKTSLACHLAYEMGAEIISGDSRQVYKNMDIGTGKDLSDYTVNGKNIPYHLIDICEAGEKYNLFEFQQDFHKAYQDIRNRGITPILCGGSGLYVESVLKGYSLPNVPINNELREKYQNYSLDELKFVLESYKSLHNTTDLENKRRAIRAIEIEDYKKQHAVEDKIYPPLASVIIGVDISREVRRQRISDRLSNRLDEGMIAEVEKILESGVDPEDLIYYGLEYKFVTQYVIGEIDREEMKEKLEIAIHQFAKRQMTWFRGMEKRGLKIHWVDGTLPLEERVDKSLEIIRNNNQ